MAVYNIAQADDDVEIGTFFTLRTSIRVRNDWRSSRGIHSGGAKHIPNYRCTRPRGVVLRKKCVMRNGFRKTYLDK